MYHGQMNAGTASSQVAILVSSFKEGNETSTTELNQVIQSHSQNFMVKYEAEDRSAESGKYDPSITSQNGGKERRLNCHLDHIFLSVFFQKQSIIQQFVISFLL